MASADFSTSSFRRYRRPWPFRADGEISRNKTHFFRPAGCGFTTLLRLGLGLRHVMLTCPQVGLVSAFCAYPPNFASDFLHPRPRGRKLALGYLVPPNWPIGDFHSRPCVMSCVHRDRPTVYPSADQRPSNVSSPATPRRRREWRWQRRRWHSPVMRRRRRRGRHPPSVAMMVTVMMVVVRDHAFRSGERSSCECDCGEGRDEFDLVHGMVPFFAWCYVFR